MLLQPGVSVDEHCNVPCRIPALTAAQARVFRKDINHGTWAHGRNNLTMCVPTCDMSYPLHRPCCSIASASNWQQQPDSGHLMTGTLERIRQRSTSCCGRASLSSMAGFTGDRAIAIGQLLVRCS